MGVEGCFPGLAVLPDFNMSECLSSGESLLEESEANEKGVSLFQHVHCNSLSKTVLGLSSEIKAVCQMKYVLISVPSVRLIVFLYLEAYR